MDSRRAQTSIRQRCHFKLYSPGAGRSLCQHLIGLRSDNVIFGYTQCRNTICNFWC